MLIYLAKSFLKDESGQGITEYGAVLGFVAALIGVALMSGQGTLLNSVKGCFSAAASNMSSLTSSS